MLSIALYVCSRLINIAKWIEFFVHNTILQYKYLAYKKWISLMMVLVFATETCWNIVWLYKNLLKSFLVGTVGTIFRQI
jgi:hypothetical protein